MYPRFSFTLHHHFGSAINYRTTHYICRRYASNNQLEWRSIFNDFGKRNNFQLHDWYELSPEKLDGKAQLIVNNYFQGSIHKLLSTLFPETEWHPWKFKYQNVPSGYWTDIANQRKYFDELGKEIGIQTLDDWYQKLSSQLLRSHGGGTLLTMHKGSAIKALKASYPEHVWHPWKFRFAPKFWKSIENQRQYFEWLGKELGVEKLDDWYNVLNQKVIGSNHAGTLLKLYNFSPSKALMACYPNHDWKPWKFQITTQKFFDKQDNITRFLSDLSEKCSIQTLDDWYRVDRVQLHQQGAARLLAKYGGLYGILKKQYPHHPWDPKKFQKGRKAQRWLVLTLKKMFPKEDILEDFIHPKAISPSSNRPLQLDAFIPSKSLAFEYQGQQHFHNVGIFQPQGVYERRDKEKRTLCAANSIKLVEVPYWWNRTQESLQQMIDKPLSAH